MRRCKRLIESMVISIIISLLVIFLCECNYFSDMRFFIKQSISFFDGKKDIIENIFIGLFASSIIALIGYIFDYCNEKKIMHSRIKKLFKFIYFKYYKEIGKDNLDIINNYAQQEVMEMIHQCDFEYMVFFKRKDDTYIKAIKNMERIEEYYGNMYYICKVMSDIVEYIKKLEKYEKELKESNEKSDKREKKIDEFFEEREKVNAFLSYFNSKELQKNLDQTWEKIEDRRIEIKKQHMEGRKRRKDALESNKEKLLQQKNYYKGLSKMMLDERKKGLEEKLKYEDEIDNICKEFDICKKIDKNSLSFELK